MKYFQVLGLNKDPFASSPDPRLLYLTHQHHDCLQQLEIVVRLRRGLGVVMGAVGTGKTTVCRRLIGILAGSGGGDHRIHIRLFLDPDFRNRREMMAALVRAFGLDRDVSEETGEWRLKEIFKKFLLEESGRRGNNILIIIDEGQKLSGDCLDLLRELLNYETNDQKLIQILVFAQNDFKEALLRHDYFRDRIARLIRLRPLAFRETRRLVGFRLSQAGLQDREAARLFTLPALWLIHRYTSGYPRRVVTVCSQVLLAFIARRLDDRHRVPARIGFHLTRRCLKYCHRALS